MNHEDRTKEQLRAEEPPWESEERYPPLHSLRAIGDLEPGDHLCCIYQTEAQHRTVLIPFLRQGLEQGQKVVYIVDAHTAETILEYLQEDGLDVKPYLARGQLVILTREEAYMRHGVFEPERMIALLRAQMAQALAEGYPALRVTGEMTWALQGLPGSERLIEYEARLNEFFPGSKCLAMCQYDRRCFDPAVLLDVLRTHPIAVVGTEVCDNFYGVPPGELLGHDLSAMTLHHWLQNLVEHKRAEEAFSETNARLQILQQVTAAVHSSLDLETVFRQITDGVVHSMGYTTAFIVTLNDEGKDFQVKAFSTKRGLMSQIDRILGFSIRDLSFPADHALNAAVRSAMEGRVVVAKTLAEIAYPLISKKACSALQRLVGTKNYILVPLQVEEEVVGGVVITSPREEVSEEALEMVQIFAHAASHAIRNANLYLQTKQTGEALRESEEWLKILFEFAPDGYYVNDLKGTFIDGNKAAEEITGYPREELIGKSFLQLKLLPLNHIPRAAALLAQNALGKSTGPDEFTLHRKDGSRVPVEIRTYPIKVKGQTLVLGIARNITERKRAERLLQALNEAALAMQRALTPEEIFTTVAEEFNKLGLSCAVFLTDESQTRLFPKYLNYEATAIEAPEKLAGLEHENVSIPIEKVDLYREVVWKKRSVFINIKNAEDLMRELLPRPARRFARQIAKMLRVSKSIDAPLIVQGEVIGLLLVQSDDLTEEDLPAITAFAHQMAAAWRKAQLMQELQNSLKELKRTQAQLIQAQKMEAIGRLAGGVAHDFNNLLTAIMGYSQFLLGELPPDDPRRLDAQEVLKAATRAASLTRQLLAFSRRQTLQPQVLDLNAIVANTEKMLRRLIGEDIDLVTLPEPRLQRVKADPGQMEQVIMNLVVNARDAMPQGGRLTIKAENVTLDEKQCALIPQARPGPFVRLSVADTGVGMDEQILQRIFEPFFTTKEGGTGLGLSVVYGIVAQHEGWITVDSEPGHGSTFKVYLPAFSPKPEVETEELVSLQGLQGHGEGILLVEDDEGVRRFTTKMLGEEGYLVFEAANVKEALDIFDRERGNIHLLFSDVVLPDGTGLQLADQLLPGEGDLRVLMSSGYTDDKSQWSVVRQRGFPFVQKPYTLPDLLRAIRGAIEQGG